MQTADNKRVYCSHICKAGMDVVLNLTLQYHSPDVSYHNMKHSPEISIVQKGDRFIIIILFCLTWQEVRAPVYIREAQGGGSDDFSRFWSHQTENLLVQTKGKYLIPITACKAREIAAHLQIQ